MNDSDVKSEYAIVAFNREDSKHSLARTNCLHITTPRAEELGVSCQRFRIPSCMCGVADRLRNES
jgi:hypothetical protein